MTDLNYQYSFIQKWKAYNLLPVTIQQMYTDQVRIKIWEKKIWGWGRGFKKRKKQRLRAKIPKEWKKVIKRGKREFIKKKRGKCRVYMQ